MWWFRNILCYFRFDINLNHSKIVYLSRDFGFIARERCFFDLNQNEFNGRGHDGASSPMYIPECFAKNLISIWCLLCVKLSVSLFFKEYQKTLSNNVRFL